MIIQNVTAEPQTLGSVNGCLDVPAGGVVDLRVIEPGTDLPRELAPALNEELQMAIRAGTWAVVSDGQALGLADSIAALEFPDPRSLDLRAPVRIDVTGAPMLSLVPFDVLTIPVGEGQTMALFVDAFKISAPPQGSRMRAGASEGVGIFGRVGSDPPATPSWTPRTADTMPADELGLVVVGNSVVLRYTAATVGPVNYTLIYRVL